MTFLKYFFYNTTFFIQIIVNKMNGQHSQNECCIRGHNHPYQGYPPPPPPPPPPCPP